MKLIWEGSFFCEDCSKEIKAPVFGKDSDDLLSNTEKERALEWAKHYHQTDNHLTCWNCTKNIKLGEIAGSIWDDGAMRILCEDCATKSN